jgi:hypothetical protein
MYSQIYFFLTIWSSIELPSPSSPSSAELNNYHDPSPLYPKTGAAQAKDRFP